MTLELIPNGDLIFKGPFNVVSTTTLKLSNSGNERLAYKIKTTAPKRYCVKPNSGFLDRRDTTSIQVMLQPQTPGAQDDRTKHKFMVQWATIPDTYADDCETFWKQDATKFAVQDSKLKCVFADEQTSAVVPDASSTVSQTRPTDSTNNVETRSQPAASSTLTQRPIDGGDDATKSLLKSELDYLRKENESLKEKLKSSDLRQRSSGIDRVDNPVTDRFKSSQSNGPKGLVLFGVNLNEQLVLVVFLLALLFGFSLGYFLFSCGN